MEKKKKICPVCSKEFKPKTPKQKFCSDACKMKEQRRKVKLIIETEPAPQALEIPKLDISIDAKTGEPSFHRRPPDWIHEVDFYCQQAGITPDQLIEEHRKLKERHSVSPAPSEVKKNPLEIKEMEKKPETYQEKRMKAKLGIK